MAGEKNGKTAAAASAAENLLALVGLGHVFRPEGFAWLATSTSLPDPVADLLRFD